MPNQETTLKRLQQVTYRDNASALEGDSIAELGNKASILFAAGTEVLAWQGEARMGIGSISNWNRKACICVRLLFRRQAPRLRFVRRWLLKAPLSFLHSAGRGSSCYF